MYHLSHVPGTVRIDRNLVWNRAGRSIAWVDGRGSTTSWATFRAWTGFEQTGRNQDPQFSPGSGPEDRLQAGSPAIDRGVRIAGLTDGYLGRAPDLGRWETR